MTCMHTRFVDRPARFRRGAGVLFGAAVAVLAACSSQGDNTSDGGTCANPGAAAPGPEDTHCEAADGGAIVQPTDMPACHPDVAAGDDGGTGAGDDGGGGDDGGPAPTCGQDGYGGYGATMYGTQAADDDCKYDVTWSATPICENQPVYFTVTVKSRADHSPVTGANVQPDVSLECAHVPNFTWNKSSPESPAGTYKVGPVTFDQPGKWTVRFHIHEDCDDILDDSPHGHAAFYVNVP